MCALWQVGWNLCSVNLTDSDTVKGWNVWFVTVGMECLSSGLRLMGWNWCMCSVKCQCKLTDRIKYVSSVLTDTVIGSSTYSVDCDSEMHYVSSGLGQIQWNVHPVDWHIGQNMFPVKCDWWDGMCVRWTVTRGMWMRVHSTMTSEIECVYSVSSKLTNRMENVWWTNC